MPENNTPQVSNDDLSKGSSYEQLNNLRDSYRSQLRQVNESPTDVHRQVQSEGVNLAGPNYGGKNFERYYNKGAYARLGFDPYIDNEKKYTEQSSKWEDVKDAGAQWWGLAGLGFNTMWSGKSDREEAEEYERYSNIGSTTRGGTFGVLNNAFLNSGYTIGLLSEMAAEEVVLAAGAALTGGLGSGVLAARTAANVGRLTKKGLDAGKMSSKLTSTIDRLKDIKDIGKAKSLYEASKKVGQAINPLRGTTEYLTTGRALDKADDVSGLAQAGKTFGAFYRDIREINLAYDEAQLESGFVSNGVKNDLINQHIEETGERPNAEEMKKINTTAATAAGNTLATNSMLIYASNRVAFGNVFNKYMPKALRNTTRAIKDGRIVKNLKTKKLDFIEGGGILGYKSLVNEAKYAATNLRTMPLNAVKTFGKYTRANFGEGMQEYFQEVIQDAESNMAKDRYLGSVAGGAWYNALFTDQYMGAYNKSMGKYISKEGAEIFAGGFVMGAFAGPFGNVSQKITKTLTDKGTYKYFYDRAGWTADKTAEQADKDKYKERLEEFNNLTDTRKQFLGNYIDFLTRQAAYKTKMETAEDQGNIKDYLDEKDNSLVEQILFAEQMGGSDLIIEQIKDLGKLSDEQLNDAFSGEKSTPIDVESFRINHDNIVDRAEKIVALSEQFDEIFPELDVFGYEQTGDALGRKLTRDHLRQARHNAKRDAIVNQFALIRSMERAQSILDKSYTAEKAPFWNKQKLPPASEITKIFNTQDFSQELYTLREEIKNLEGFTQKDPTQSKDLRYKKKIYKILEKFADRNGGITAYMNALSEQEFNDLEVADYKPLAVDSEVTYGTGDKTWTGTIVGETKNKKGRQQWIIEKENGKRVRVLKDSKNLPQAPTKKDYISKPTKELRKIYKEYMEAVAKESNNAVNDSQINESFQDFKDFYALDADQTNLTKHVNMLMNPEGHYALVERYNEQVTKNFQEMESRVKSQMDLYKDSENMSMLIQMLAKAYNVIIEEDDLVALSEDNHIPEDIIDINTGEKLSETSDTYYAVQNAISNWIINSDKADVEEVTEEVTEEEVSKPEVVAIDMENTPFEEWPEEVRMAIRANMNTYNQTNGEDYFDDIEDYIALGNPGYEFAKARVNKYNSEVTAEEVVEEVPIKEVDKKADIEKKRQEELDAYYSQGNIIDPVFHHIRDQIANTKLIQPSEIEAVNKFLKALLKLNLSQQEMIDKLNKKFDFLDIQYKETEIDRINAKYDAELAALESTQQTDEVEIKEPTEKEVTLRKPSVVDIESAFELEVPQNIDNNLFNGETKLIAFKPSLKSGTPMSQIINNLRDGVNFPSDGNLEDMKPGTVITISKKVSPNKTIYVELTYKGQTSSKDLGLTEDELIEQFNLDFYNAETDPSEIIIDGKSYGSPSLIHTNWLDGTGQLPVFEVSAPIEKKTSGTEQSVEAWRNNIEERLVQSNNIDQTLNDILDENVLRMAEERPSVTTEEINEIFEKVKGEITPDKLAINEEYKVDIRVKVDGKSINFGTAIVSDITNSGVTFISTGKETKGTVKYINAETLPNVLKGRVSTDMRADDIVETPKTTAEQKEINKESMKVDSEITAEQLNEEVANIDSELDSGKSIKELKAEARAAQKEENKKCD